VQKRFLFSLASLVILLVQPAFAQKEGAIWYFGQNAGLDFNQYYPKPLTDGKIETREGVATICDKDGQLLFYTDGQKVYNRKHVIMLNGDNLFGDVSSTQSSIIVPKPGPGTPILYYIFTVDKAGTTQEPGKGLNYSVVDITKDGSYGQVIEKNRPLLQNSTEKITAVKNKAGDSYWIIAHGWNQMAFYCYLLTSTGEVRAQDPISVGSQHQNSDPDDRYNRGATGYLKSSPKGDYLALAIEGQHMFELFSFDNTSGDIKFLANLPACSPGNITERTGNAYGVEFSPTGNYLYGSTRQGGIIYQWDLSKIDERTIQNSVTFIRADRNILCGALQLGLNGKIYVSLSGQPFLGVINSPIQKNCNYDEHGATLMDNSGSGNGGKAYFGLPTFLSDFFKAAEFYYENTCQNDVTRFYMSANRGTVEGLPSWEIWDATGTTKLGQAFVSATTMEGTYQFALPGVYLVKFKVTQFGGTISQTQQVTIHPLPELNFPDTTSMCKGSPARLDAGDGAFYRWSDNLNLNVERFRNVYVAKKYVVTVTHYDGCSSSDSTLVVEQPLPVIKDTLVTLAGCGSKNGSIVLEMEHPVDQYDFSWKQFPGNTTNEALNLPFGVYEVTITSRETGCVLTSKISVNEDNAPAVGIRSSVIGKACPGAKITLTAEGAVQYLWENPEGLVSSTVEVAPWQTTTYRVEGYSLDPVTQQKCSAFGEITIEVFPFNLPDLGADHIGCQGDTIELDGGNEYTAWKWSNNETTRLINITETTPNLILYATDNNKCILTDTTNITIKPLPEINLGPDITQCKADPLILTGGPGDYYYWDTGDTTQQIQVNESGNYHLTIRKNGCINNDSIQVTIKPLPEVHLPADTTVCVSEPITLNGGTGDSYLWSTGETTSDISVNTSGIYTLTINLDGCKNSDEIDLTIKPLPEVNLGRDTVLCKSSPISLSGGTGDSYAWSTGATSPSITVNETGIYTLSISKLGCLNSDTVSIRVNDPAKLVIDSVTTNPVTCPGNRDGSLRIYAQGSGESYEYSIDDGLNYSSTPWFQGLYGNNQFQIMVREDKACTLRYPAEITFNEPDSIRIKYHLVSPSCESCPDGEINLTIKGGTPPYSVKWSTNDTVTYLSNMVLGKYLVWITDASKCRENALIDLTLDFPPFQIPNAFTPNGDGVNEKWVIRALNDFPECEVKIFNRSGKLIWWSEPGYPEPWDGIDKSGNAMPIGAYYYLVWLSSDLKPIKGSVSILK